jgi:hypothetical protein
MGSMGGIGDMSKESKEKMPKGTARQQLEELQYKTGLTSAAIKDKLRGLGEDTFGAPTLTSSRGKLTRGPLTVASFDEGGEAKKDPVGVAAKLLNTFNEYGKKAEEFGLKAVGTFPAGCTPQVPIDHARWYPIYSVCAELGIPIFICAGIPGPRVPSMCQHVELLDIVCYDFPELKIVTRHGCQPWTELAVKLMLKWPNLYYSTSAFAPQHYDPRIIDYANSRGSDRVIYAGYWPMGLTYERIMGDMPKVPFKKDVWPKFLRQNALSVLGLSDLPG